MPGWMPRVNGYSPGSPRRSSRPGADVVGVVEALDLDPRVGEAAVVVGADDRGDVAVQVVGDGLGLLFLVGVGRLRLLGRTGRHGDRIGSDYGSRS